MPGPDSVSGVVAETRPSTIVRTAAPPVRVQRTSTVAPVVTPHWRVTSTVIRNPASVEPARPLAAKPIESEVARAAASARDMRGAGNASSGPGRPQGHERHGANALERTTVAVLVG